MNSSKKATTENEMTGKVISERGMIRSMCIASNQGNQVKIAQLIKEGDFSSWPQAQDAAIRAFSVAPNNVCRHLTAAEKMLDFQPLGASSALRLSTLKEMVRQAKA